MKSILIKFVKFIQIDSIFTGILIFFAVVYGSSVGTINLSGDPMSLLGKVGCAVIGGFQNCQYHLMRPYMFTKRRRVCKKHTYNSCKPYIRSHLTNSSAPLTKGLTARQNKAPPWVHNIILGF